MPSAARRMRPSGGEVRSVGAPFGRPLAAKGRPYGGGGSPCPTRCASGSSISVGAGLSPSLAALDSPLVRGGLEKSLPLMREVAGQRPDGGRERAATRGHSCGDTYHVGPRPTRLPPLRGKLSAVRLTDEGAHGDDGRFFPLPPHPALRATFPPVGGRQGAPGSRPRPASLGPSGQFTFSRPTQAARFCP